jgi:hypothetical protein
LLGRANCPSYVGLSYRSGAAAHDKAARLKPVRSVRLERSPFCSIMSVV